MYASLGIIKMLLFEGEETMQLKYVYQFIFVGIMVFVFTSSSSAGVALHEEFDTDLSLWKVLSTGSPDANDAAVSLTGWGELQIDLFNNQRFRYQGVQSKEAFTIPAGGMLVADFYGVNQALWGNSSHSDPFWALSVYGSELFLDLSYYGWIGVKGWNAYWGDWVQWPRLPSGEPDGYQFIEVDNPTPPPTKISLTNGNYKHVIITVDASFIKVYIEDDYYENLTSPTALYTAITSNIFTAEEVALGFYVSVAASHYTEWFTGQCSELFDGVKVSRIGATAPMNCYEARDMGYGVDGADINQDCRHDFVDFSFIAQDWLLDVNP